MAKKKPTPKKPRRKAKELEQNHLPGTAPEKNPKVHAAAEHYYDVMMERTDLSKKEAEANERLVEIMHEEGVTFYQYQKLQVDLTKTEKARVKMLKDKNGEGSG